MGIAGASLDLIRTVFNRNRMAPLRSSYYDLNVYAAMGALQRGDVLSPQSGYNSYLTDSVDMQQDLMNRYADYEEMSHYPELGAALEIYADDATVQDISSGKSIWFEAKDERIALTLNDMLNVNLRAEESLWELAYSLCKYGDNYEELVVIDGEGVVQFNPLSPPTTRRIEDRNGILYGFVNDPSMSFSLNTNMFLEKLMQKSASGISAPGLIPGTEEMTTVYEPWELVHFRLRGHSRTELYGRSVLDAARWVWRRLTMMEDAMVLYKLTRSPQRYAFYVDVGDVPPNQAKQFVNKVKQEFKKNKYVDQNGKLNFRYNVLSAEEDIWLPVRKGKRSTEIDVLSGPEGQQVEDVNYFRDKMFAALKIPKSYLGADETIGRANLSQLDVRFCRTVMRVQREIKNGYDQTARVHLSAKNIDPDQVDYQCHMVVPSGAMELAQVEVQNAKLELASKYKDANFSEYHIWSKVLGIPDEEIAAIQQQRLRQNGGQVESRDVNREIDRAMKLDRRALDETNRVLDEIREGNSLFAKRIKELRMLVSDISHATPKRRRIHQ